MQKKTVLIIDNSIDTTGALNAILGFAQYAQKDYHFVFVLPVGSKAVDKVEQKGFTTETLPFLEISKSLKSLVLYLPTLLINAWRLRRLAKKHQAAILHGNDFYNLAGIIAKIMGGDFTLITHVRFMPDRFPSILVKLWINLNLKYADTVVCVSKAVCRCLPQHAKIQVIYDRLSGIPVNSTKNKRNNSYLNLLYLAHYIPGKGQDYALEAFYKAYHQLDHLRLKFVGGDMGLEKNKAFKNRLMARAQDLGLKDIINFNGPTTNTAKEIQSADIMLNFSESESFSMTCLEALSYGVPLIATDCGGPAELFEHGKSGLLVPNRDVNAMKEAMLKLANEPDSRRAFSNKGKIYVICKFSLEKTSHQLNKLYKDVLSC